MSISLRDAEQCRQNPDLTPGLWLRNLHGEGQRDIFFLEPLRDGQTVDCELITSAAELCLRATPGCIRFFMDEPDRLRIRLEGMSLRLTMRGGAFNSAVPLRDDCWRLNAASAIQDYTLLRLAGHMAVQAPWQAADCRQVTAQLNGDADRVAEFVLVQSKGQQPIPTGFAPYQEAVDEVAREFESFALTCPVEDSSLQDTARLAAYVNWSAIINPCGHIMRPAMLMSKNWMCNVWSWDHCFNALALAPGWPELAWDQFMLIFDHQTEQGQLPDMINDVTTQYNFVKPPVHGWTFRKLMAAHAWFRAPERLREAYARLAAWTHWWLTYRDPDGSGLPCYHHGNDSGWDNGTVFDVGLPARGADLATFLILQMDLLADLAQQLGETAAASEWGQRSAAMHEALLRDLWVDDRFVTRHVPSGQYNVHARSIIPCMPILLGNRLPPHVRGALVSRIRENLTDWGLATEHPESALYQADGYWRGPIWAPSTMLLADGLQAAGEMDLARTVRERFQALCVSSGFAENFDAITGAPLRDRGYTWTASVFLALAGQLRSDGPDRLRGRRGLKRLS